MTQSEEVTLNNLAAITDIIIKPADRGGRIVNLAMEKYKDEAYSQLNNDDHYQPLDHDPSVKYSQAILPTLTDLLARELIPTTELNIMRPTNMQAGGFYRSSKIYKVPADALFSADVLGTPIVSNKNTPTEALSVFLSQQLADIPTSLPPFVQEHLPAFLSIIETKNRGRTIPNYALLVPLDASALYTNIPITEAIEGTPNGALLLPIDVSALYTHIPITEAIEGISTAIAENGHQHAAEGYITLLKLVLALKCFQFDSSYYLQDFGTSMGTPFAPTYAHIFMGKLEAALLNSFPQEPKVYL